ncbi:MAG: tyrosine--tRNA ligase [Chloroflexi bacterium]|nr:tyrosine--tRNA ligase [Chloroflexota bacterium]
MDIIEELRWRGSIFDITPGAEELVGSEKIPVYVGFDPTARSLHVGNMVPIMGLVRMQRHGHSPIAIAGAGTGMIGDPSGRDDERQLLSVDQIDENVENIKRQLAHFLDFDTKSNPARVINNADWLRKVGMTDFLRDVGKHFTVNYMLAKESVASRMVREQGISYTEFSYMLLQAYDFLVLHDTYGCKMQMGGSDQWGNILAGVDLIRRARGEQAHALAYPLITTASGQKFGKSVGGAPTLDPEETSPYRFYQFWINVDDADVVPYLKLFTLLGPDEIGGYEEAVASEPQKREAQRALAETVTEMVHGPNGVAAALKATDVLFGGELDGLSAAELLDIFADVPSTKLQRDSFQGEGMPVAQLLTAAGAATSNGEARRLIEGGGVYLNNVRVTDARSRVGINQATDGEVILLRRGARNYHMVRLV